MDITETYVAWLNAPEINRFLESRFDLQTLESVRGFVEAMNESENDILFGIFLKDGNRHIGNIRLGPIDHHHKRAAIGLLIGDGNQHGKGYASEAISAVTDFAFTSLGLRKVFAGYYAANTASRKAFRNAGFTVDARLREHWLCDGEWQDGIIVSRLSACDSMAD